MQTEAELMQTDANASVCLSLTQFASVCLSLPQFCLSLHQFASANMANVAQFSQLPGKTKIEL